jgi:hypothetical protein
MNISMISFILALIVMTVLIVILFKQKAKPTQKRKFKPEAMEGTKAPEPAAGQFNPALVQSKWAEIQAMSSAGPSGLKNALFEADKLLDYCMIGKNFQGETMGDRLKSGGGAFNNLNAIWSAHKLRNQLAHEVEIDTVEPQIKQAINDLGQGIRDLGISI